MTERICECGCGEVLPVPKFPSETRRFVHGHNAVRAPEPRFWARVQWMANGCWWWTGHVSPAGYGMMSVGGSPYYMHRFAYEMLVGPIPEGLTIDHLCHNAALCCEGGASCMHRRCVCPDHLEAVTDKVNISRGNAPSAKRARSTHCAKGHEFTPENTYRTKDGKRQCKTCNHERYLAAKAAKLAART